MATGSYAVRVHRAWIGGGAPDPESYFLTREEAITLIDSLLEQGDRQLSLFPATFITVAPLGLFQEIVEPDPDPF